MIPKKESLHCVICGRDITRSMKIYPYGFLGGSYCYDCAAEEKKPSVPRKKVSVSQAVQEMYARGKKPSEIAEAKGISVQEVYKLLNNIKPKRERRKP